jgi:hypothetical protein
MPKDEFYPQGFALTAAEAAGELVCRSSNVIDSNRLSR